MFPVPANVTKLILDDARGTLDGPGSDDEKLRLIWAKLCNYRGQVMGKLLKNTVGSAVQNGPFKGMQLTPALLSEVSAPTPHLLGIYEHELHPAIEAAIAAPYQQVLNIGCNHGYYAVGLALRMPQAQVHAFDIEPKCVAYCREMAELNGVGDRVTTGGLFRGEDFATYAGQRTLVFMDIEGAEIDLLDPERYPALQQMDVIVELHALLRSNLPATIVSRFKPTHDFTGILNKASVFDFTGIVGEQQYVDPVDSFVATWECRTGPTPWGVFRVKGT